MHEVLTPNERDPCPKAPHPFNLTRMASPRPNARVAFQCVIRPSAAVAPGTQMQSQGLEEPVPQLVHGLRRQFGLLPLTNIY